MTTDHQNGNGAGELTRTEQALLASELSYRRLFEGARDGILILDVETGRVDDVNPFLVELLGFSRSEMVGKTVGELSPFKDIVANQSMLEKLQKDGYVRYRDLPLETKDGRQIEVEIISNVYRVGDRSVIQCNVRDNTERKASEQQLTLLKTCMSNLNDLVMITEADAIDEPGPKLVFVNQAFERVTGYNSAEVLGRSPRFLQGEKTDRLVLAQIREALVKQKQFRGCLINYKKDGESFCLDLEILPIFDSIGKCTQFCSIGRDITESKKLKDSLKLFRTLMEQSPDAIEIIDPQSGRFLDINQTAHERLGYTREEMLSMSMTDIVADERGPISIQQAVEELRKTGVSIVETRHRRKNGTTFPVEVNVQHIDLDKGYRVALVRDITNRRLVEQTLRDNEVKFRTLFEVANDANFVLHDGLFVDCNAKASELFGATREQLIGQCPSLFSPTIQPGGNDSFVQATGFMQKALAGHPQFFEWVHQRLDGVTVYTDISLHRFELGEQIYLQCVVRDITGRKKIEKQLIWRTAFFEAQVHSALDGILIVDDEGKKILQNQRLSDLWNIPQEVADESDDQRQRDWVANQTTDPRKFIEKVIHLYEHPDEISRDEIALVDGRWFDRYSAPVRGRDGKYFGRIWNFRDVTERRRINSHLRLQSAALEAAANAIVITDKDGIIEWANTAFTTNTGYTVAEAIGQNPRLLKSGKQDEKFYQEMWNAVSTGKVWHGEIINRRKDGVLYTEEMTITPVRSDVGEIEHFIAVKQDITARKKIEAQFMRAQRMESIGTLAGGIAHDLNNILAPILMSIDILKLTATDPQAQKVLETIGVSAQRGADIVRQVLSFARGMEGERIEIQPKHLLKDIECIIRDTFPKDITLHFSIPSDTWTILGDPTQVHQVLLNLCVNARDAMPNGGTLTIGVENCVLDKQYSAMDLHAKAGRYVVISVSDSGTGIPPEILDKIFEPFFTTKGLNKGTGLGLSTVMAVVKSHAGSINVYSEPGKGTNFKVYLPAMETASEVRKESQEQAHSPRGNGETILVVDDEMSILAITSQTLQAFGYRVLTAPDGAEAVAVYAQHKDDIALVLTDMAMPVMDGAAMIHALKRINPAIKVIAASGLHEKVDFSNITRLGIKGSLTKPYTAALLLRTIRTILDKA